VPQAHQIYDRARRIVDPDQLAGRGLDAAKTKLERLSIEPENLRRPESRRGRRRSRSPQLAARIQSGTEPSPWHQGKP
jgi:hypothetical protein